MRSGGNVVDAAIATNAMLGVTQPNYCGVGGDLFCLYYEALTRKVHFLNGAGRSGSRATLDELSRRGLDRVPTYGPASVSVPGVTRAWRMLLEEFGTRPLRNLLEPAVHYARHGFAISDIVCQAIRERAPGNDDPEWRRIFIPRGEFPTVGQCFRQVELARALSDLGDDPELFYLGWWRFLADPPRPTSPGPETGPRYRRMGDSIRPRTALYRVRDAAAHQGLAALLSLNLLEGFDLASLPFHSVEHLHLLLEVTKIAYADRDRWVADPEHARLPIAQLLDKGYANKRRLLFDPRKAQPYQWGDPEGDTTGFVVADGRGNVLSVIQSLYKSFGSGMWRPAPASCCRIAARISTPTPSIRITWHRASAPSTP